LRETFTEIVDQLREERWEREKRRREEERRRGEK
jgi:hypothetical protein